MTQFISGTRSSGRTTTGVFACFAMYLAEHGWRVFPLVPRTKIPYAGSRSHLDATDDLTQVSRWAEETPDANVGLRPPPGVVVVDVDDPREFRRWLAEQGLALPDTREVRTRRGQHLYYRLPQDVSRPVRAQLQGVKVDLKTERGFVLAPGSVASSGKIYRLVRELPLPELPELPEAWLPHVLRPAPKPRPARAAVAGQGELPAATDPTRLARLLSVKRPGQGRRSFLRWGLCEAWRTFGDDPRSLQRALDALERTGLQVGLDPDDVTRLSEWAAEQYSDQKDPQ
ncbi:bifunctional DNA primase/polymerase [Williamsia muralis]|uniref:bifunctional DNA primase/polymerase n=1 Tax=Williamsia marianensis TaxID=85044 RepID=UPI000DE67649|nr:bifunctional DNA primase/polymerase [Williamsia marianensis]PVY29918.1 bifunctional DNA primase/polymerase-like protein [Williamsia marianensis]